MNPEFMDWWRAEHDKVSDRFPGLLGKKIGGWYVSKVMPDEYEWHPETDEGRPKSLVIALSSPSLRARTIAMPYEVAMGMTQDEMLSVISFKMKMMRRDNERL